MQVRQDESNLVARLSPTDGSQQHNDTSYGEAHPASAVGAPTWWSLKWWTIAQASNYVQTHPATLRREIRAGRLRAVRVGGRKAIRLRRTDLDRWLEQATVVASATSHTTASD